MYYNEITKMNEGQPQFRPLETIDEDDIGIKSSPPLLMIHSRTVQKNQKHKEANPVLQKNA